MRCAEKVAYRSQAKARQAMHRVKAHADQHGWLDPTGVYRCPDCGSWHITTWPKEHWPAAATEGG